MNSLYRSVSIYSRHHSLLPLRFPSAKIMIHSPSAEGRSSTPKNNSTSLIPFSLDEEQFPPLGVSTKKSGKGSRRSEVDPSSIKDSTPVKSSESQNWESGKDASSLESKDRDQSLIRRKIKVDLGSTNTCTPSKRSQSSNSTSRKDALSLPTEFYVAVGRRSDTKEPTFGSSLKYKGNGSNPCKDALFSVFNDSSNLFTLCKHSQSQDWRILDTRIGIKGDRFRVFNRSLTDQFTVLEANKPTFCTGPKHKGDNSQRRRSSDGYTNSSTPSKHPQSQDWRICKDGFSPKWKPRDQRRPFDICSSTSIKDLSVEEEEVDEKETEQQTVDSNNKNKVLRPGMVLLKHYLTHHVQVDIVKTCRELGLKPHGFYQPGYSAGSKLRLQMMCLGRNWDPQTKYGNKNIKTDKIPETFRVLVEQAIRQAQALIDKEDAERILPSMSPDICIVNFYTETGRLGLHQDRDESRESIVKGLPIVSFSIGDSAEFLYGEERDVEKAELVKLESGDVLIFGGQSRMVFHGVKSIIPNSAPMSLLDESKLRTGRLNLTFRHF